MPLKMYLDGSGTAGVILTLGAVVADNSVWLEFEPAWDDVLARYGVPYSHMKELTGRRGPFTDWTDTRREQFAAALVATIEGFPLSDRMRQYGCWIDLVAHERWRKARNHPSPHRLCARVLFPTFLDDYPGLIDSIDLRFDQGEPFMTHLREDWDNRKIRRQAPVWGIVRTMAPHDMKTTPALQVADLIAWSRTRYETAVRPKLGQDGLDVFSVLAARVLNHGLRGIHREIGEKAMAESTFAEEGLRRLFYSSEHASDIAEAEVSQQLLRCVGGLGRIRPVQPPIIMW